jgi:hypothetical protein
MPAVRSLDLHRHDAPYVESSSLKRKIPNSLLDSPNGARISIIRFQKSMGKKRQESLGFPA